MNKFEKNKVKNKIVFEVIEEKDCLMLLEEYKIYNSDLCDIINNMMKGMNID